ncbi:ATP-binding protein [Fictibacillus sp. 18YEL24]|uniref:ATP-binding protein n=1 Tax=Fictibacillus sp. 18YEL24 TaxID=2745875 RepID=UPI0018CDC2F5|nr:ATP-binding protein [Fictibacillus sp. 18YEL24]MBH0171048.1 ATP-binding protein [Fictibacillus sp. 18YEL24]
MSKPKFSGIQAVLEDLKQKSASQSQADKSVGSEEESQKHECLKCKDKRILIFRVHKDTKWIEDEKTQSSTPESMVTEDEFYSGRVCHPKDAWEWRDTFSQRCDCSIKRKIQKIMKSSEITDAFKKMAFSNFERVGKHELIQEAYQCAIDYYRDFDSIKGDRCNSISLLGQPGCGKTHLLTAIANNLIHKKQVSVLYFPFVEGFNDLKDNFDLLEEKLSNMKKVDVLFIDDLFKPVTTDSKEGRKRKPRATEWQIEQIYAVINFRYLNHKPMLISSELNVDELIDIDEALGTRIYQMSKDYTVVIEGDRKLLNYRLA